MLMLSSVLVDESSQLHVRNAAGLALKNALSARVRIFLRSSYLHILFRLLSVCITGGLTSIRILN